MGPSLPEVRPPNEKKRRVTKMGRKWREWGLLWKGRGGRKGERSTYVTMYLAVRGQPHSSLPPCLLPGSLLSPLSIFSRWNIGVQMYATVSVSGFTWILRVSGPQSCLVSLLPGESSPRLMIYKW